MNKRTHVGLDVHARSVKGCAIDRETGEILRQSLEPSAGRAFLIGQHFGVGQAEVIIHGHMHVIESDPVVS